MRIADDPEDLGRVVMELSGDVEDLASDDPTPAQQIVQSILEAMRTEQEEG